MSVINSRMLALRTADENIDKDELRPSRYGAVDTFIQQDKQPGSLVTQSMRDAALNSNGRVLEVPVFDFDGDVEISNVRTVEIADSENTTQMVQVHFATFAWGFTQVPAAMMNNEKTKQEDFNRKFLKYLYKFAEVLDSAAIAALSAGKTSVFKDALHYPVIGNTVTVNWADRESIFGDITPIMSANDYFGQLHLIGNGGLESIALKLMQHGLYNDQNKQLELNQKVLHFSNRIQNASGKYATVYAVPDAQLGILTRFERESLLGTISKDGHEWSTDVLPMINFPVGTYYYQSVGNQSGIAGDATADLVRGLKEHFGFAIDVAFITPYNSDPSTIASPIMKVAILRENAS